MLVSLEVDLINDFIYGSMRIPGVEKILPAVEVVSKKIHNSTIPRFVVRDFHFEDDYEIKHLHPKHAMAYTKGCYFIPELNSDTGFFCLPDKINEGKQFIWRPGDLEAILKSGINRFVVEKQHYSAFSNPALSFVMNELNATDAIVYGVSTDHSIKETVLDAQYYGIQCHVVEDLIRGMDARQSVSALELMKSAGAKAITLNKALSMISGGRNV